MRRIMLLFILLPAFRGEGTACTIFIGSNDQSTFVGNNEDYTPSVNTFLWIRPRQQGRYGYIFWGFEEKYPEGGMNDKGLFMDAAALSQKIVLERNPLKPDFNGYLTETILRQCSTVEEVITLVKKYNLTWQEKAQILVADHSGDYAIIHANYIIRKTTSVFVLTNYSLRDPAAKDFSCWRRNTAYKYLSGPDLSVAQFREILSKTAQTEPDNATVYSQVCDLRKGIIYLYRLHDFSVADTINLSALLLQGAKSIAIRSLFPQSIGDTLLHTITTSSIQEALDLYRRIKKGPDAAALNFSEAELDRVAYILINDHKIKEAIAIFQLNLQAYPGSANAHAGLGNAFLLDGQEGKADEQYLAAAILDPGNVYTGLLQKRADGMVDFRLDGFDGARQVLLFLQGTHSDFRANAPLILKKEGIWSCRLNIPPGNYTYSFKVDDSWISDPGNHLAQKIGKYWSSYLVVRPI